MEAVLKPRPAIVRHFVGPVPRSCYRLKSYRRYPGVPVFCLNAGSAGSLKSDLETVIQSQGVEHRASTYEDAIYWIGTKPTRYSIVHDSADDISMNPYSFFPRVLMVISL